MKLTGLHLLLTYECNYECDHCFVWSSPRQSGTMTLDKIERILDQAGVLGRLHPLPSNEFLRIPSGQATFELHRPWRF